MMIAKIQRYREALKHEKDPDIVRDIRAIITGISNFELNIINARNKARERLEKHCSGCKFFIDEPLESEIVIDKVIPQLSGKICSDCGCVASYKLRQSIKKCKKWS
ncbi:hypothetical protein [Elizabethkingia sp. M8]|uniref:hypothetical protein n=1 Tax=Elizabethkingia sp. M8 TaxID=2796140 RepID=UPI001905CD8B|nr:hypothetical protein [Elizabethkingia sp. M8]QQM25255.1 hypothetical protein JCR23_10080 [Elizabethkingia sp. M8]QQM25935.1 hypothetical protein JCR23_13775 [Elizabethkingia sp. M8]